MQYLVFAGCCLIWGSTFLAIRIGNEAVPPIWAATTRLVLAAPLLTLLVLATRQRFPRGPALRGALLFGIFNFGVNLSLLYWVSAWCRAGSRRCCTPPCPCRRRSSPRRCASSASWRARSVSRS